MIQQLTTLVIVTSSPEQTEALGVNLGKLLHPGMLITLSGELGGGKTCLARGIAKTLAPDHADQVASPTYALMHQYGNSTPVYHFDCYRLRDADDAYELGMQDYLHSDGVCLIEWPERIMELLPAERLTISFEHCGDDCRRLTFTALGQNALLVISQLSQMT